MIDRELLHVLYSNTDSSFRNQVESHRRKSDPYCVVARDGSLQQPFERWRYGRQSSNSRWCRYLHLLKKNLAQSWSLLLADDMLTTLCAQDSNLVDNSETVYISSLALLKMLRHGRAGVPMEVMGLMLGEFVDDYTVRVVDVFAMPQSGTGVSVEAVDPVFQTKMMDMLRQTGRFVGSLGTTTPSRS